MVPGVLREFLVATVTASASFIGLLFVAISFVMNDEKDSLAEAQRKRILAESSYAALLSIFFISLVALIPGTSIGWVTILLAWAGLGNVLHLLRSGPKALYDTALLVFSALVYLGQGAYGIAVWHAGSHHPINKYGFMAFMLILFSLALGRAWELTGIRKT